MKADHSISASSQSSQPSALKRFKFLTEKLSHSTAAVNATRGTSCASIEGEIGQYLSELLTMLHSEEEAPAFWSKRHASYPLLAPLAEDLLAASASKAYVERVFSVCGWLTVGRRNRLTKNLEKRVL